MSLEDTHYLMHYRQSFSETPYRSAIEVEVGMNFPGMTIEQVKRAFSMEGEWGISNRKLNTGETFDVPSAPSTVRRTDDKLEVGVGVCLGDGTMGRVTAVPCFDGEGYINKIIYLTGDVVTEIEYQSDKPLVRKIS